MPPKTQIEVRRDRPEFEICWPHVIRLDRVMRQKLRLDLDSIPTLELNAADTRLSAELAPVVDGQTDFEKLTDMGDLLTGVIVSGVRADDMAVRFKYAGVPAEKLKVIKDYSELLKACLAQNRPVFIMPTYTAMLDLRATVSKNYGFKNFWE